MKKLSMKRCLIFALLGPLFGLMTLVIYTGHNPFILDTLWVAPFAYVYGILPALAAGFADWSYSRLLGVSPRVALTAATGALVVSSLANLSAMRPYTDQGELTMWALAGGVAAALCSWLSSERAR